MRSGLSGNSRVTSGELRSRTFSSKPARYVCLASVSFAGSNEISTYFVSAAAVLFVPEFEATRLNADLGASADYLRGHSDNEGRRWTRQILFLKGKLR